MNRGSPACAERSAYGEPYASVTPSGNVCQMLNPPSASQSMKRRASAPNVPRACGPGNEVGWSRTPARRSASSFISRRSGAPAQAGQHPPCHEHDALVGHMKVLTIGLVVAADDGAVRNAAAFVDDRVRDVATAADLDLRQHDRAAHFRAL